MDVKWNQNQAASKPNRPLPFRVPKVIGSDVELGNFVLGMPISEGIGAGGTGRYASRIALDEIPGIYHNRWSQRSSPASAVGCGGGKSRQAGYSPYSGYSARPAAAAGKSGHSANTSYDAQDWGRKFLPTNGGCAYIDLNHLELPNPEVLSAYDYVAAWHAMLRIARQAGQLANEKLPDGLQLQLLANNSDGLGNSYGSHLSFLITREAFDNIFQRRLHYMLYLAAYQASSIIFTGQGKVGAENGAPEVDYQISQRADFFETLTGLQTTHHRPIINARDEALCGNHVYGLSDRQAANRLARLHVIFYDSNLCHVSCLLKAGVMQLVLAMIEARRINPNLILDDPLDSVVRWSHDPTLQARMPMASGRWLTAPELQTLFLDEAQTFFEEGGFDQIVPHAEQILAQWRQVLDKLRAEKFDELTGSIDWILKLHILQRARQQRPDLRWDSPELKHLDHLYSNLDAGQGLYWAYQQHLVTRLVSDAQIERLVHEPPEDTRAWGRAMLLRLAGADQIDHIDWDFLRFRLVDDDGWCSFRTVPMADPLGFTKAEVGHLFDSKLSLEEVIDAVTVDRG